MQPAKTPHSLQPLPLSSNLKINSLTYTLNSQKEHDPPCLTPLLSLKTDDLTLPHIQQKHLSF